MSAAMSCLIFGSTGQTGRNLFKSVLSHPTINHVTEAGRRSVFEAGILSESEDLVGKEKLSKHVTIDFGAGEESCTSEKEALQSKDIVYITLGTTRKNAKSTEAFEAIDRGYPVLAAKLSRTPDRKQTLVYCSTAGASASSPFLYPKSKGLTEIELANLGYEETIIFRPGALANTERLEFRLLESLLLRMTGVLACFTDSAQIPVSTLGSAMAKAGVLGYAGLEKHGIGQKTSAGSDKHFWLIGNADAIKLSKIEP